MDLVPDLDQENTEAKLKTMSLQSRSALKTTLASDFLDNTTGLITPAKFRSLMTNFIDSFVNNTDDVGIYSAQVDIVSADVLTAYTTPVELVPAPGAGKIILPLAIFTDMDYNSSAYATNTTMRFGWDGASAGTAVLFGTQAGILNQTTDELAWFFPTTGNVASLTSAVNKNFCFSVSTGNPTAGNSPLIMTIIYLVITL